MGNISKVIYSDEVLIDITDSTVNEDNLMSGEIAYASSGARIVGRATAGNNIDLSVVDGQLNQTYGDEVDTTDAMILDSTLQDTNDKLDGIIEAIENGGGAEIPTKTSDLTNDGEDGTKPFLTDHQDISGKINEPTSEGQNGYALLTDGNGGRTWGQVASDQYITSTSNDFSVSNKKLSLASSVSSKLSALDSDGKIDYSNVKNTPTIPTKTSDLTNNSGYVTSSSLDSWHKYNGSVEVNTVNVIDTSTQIVFHDINSSKAYDLYFETSDGSMPTLESSALSGTTLTYTVQTKVSGTKFKLREII